MNIHTKSILTSLARYFALALLIALPTAIVMLDVLWLGNNIGEESLTEHMQSTVLLLIISTFIYIIAKHEDKRPFTYLALGLFISMLFREHDYVLNNIVDNLWEVLVVLTVITVTVLSRSTNRPFKPAFAEFLSSSAGRTMVMSILILLVHSRLFGMGILWKTILNDGYVNTVKNAMEEGTELLAYVLIFYATQVYRRTLATEKK